MYMHAYMYMYVCLYTRMRTYVRVYMYISPPLRQYLFVDICAPEWERGRKKTLKQRAGLSIHTYCIHRIHAGVHTCTYAYIFLSIYIQIWCIYFSCIFWNMPDGPITPRHRSPTPQDFQERPIWTTQRCRFPTIWIHWDGGCNHGLVAETLYAVESTFCVVRLVLRVLANRGYK